MEENQRREIRKNLLDGLPYLMAGINGYRVFEKSLQEYKSMGPEELYKKLPPLLKLIIKLFEENFEDFLSLSK